jgi:hypothetical protein
MRAALWRYNTRALWLRFLEFFEVTTFFQSTPQQFPAHLIEIIPVEVSRSEVIFDLRQTFFEEGKPSSTIKRPHQGEKIAKCVLRVNTLWIRFLSVLTSSAFLETMEGREEGPAKRNENGVDCA